MDMIFNGEMWRKANLKFSVLLVVLWFSGYTNSLAFVSLRIHCFWIMSEVWKFTELFIDQRNASVMDRKTKTAT